MDNINSSNFVNYMKKLRDDMLWQFRKKSNTDVLLKAFARQFDELYEVFWQLETLRWINTASGIQLDRIGDIVVLSRTQAAKLEEMRTNQSVGIINDDVYRMWLRYKMFLNTFDGTYKDFMRNIRMFWEETVLYYSEEPEHPATIILDTPELAGIFNPEELFNIPVIKPGGVQLLIRARTITETDPLEISVAGISNIKFTTTNIKENERETKEEKTLPVSAYIAGIFTTTNLKERE